MREKLVRKVRKRVQRAHAACRLDNTALTLILYNQWLLFSFTHIFYSCALPTQHPHTAKQSSSQPPYT